jgi:hypothetical protein
MEGNSRLVTIIHGEESVRRFLQVAALDGMDVAIYGSRAERLADVATCSSDCINPRPAPAAPCGFRRDGDAAKLFPIVAITGHDSAETGRGSTAPSFTKNWPKLCCAGSKKLETAARLRATRTDHRHAQHPL